MKLKAAVFTIFLLVFSVTLLGFAELAFAERLTIGNAGVFLDSASQDSGLSRTDLATGAGSTINVALQIVSTLFLVLIVYGGFLILTARGEEAQFEKGKNTIVASVIGIVIIVSAFAITNLVTARLVKDAQGTPPVEAGAQGNQPLGCCVIDMGLFPSCSIRTASECERIFQNFVEDGAEGSSWSSGVNAADCNLQCS